MLSNVTNLNLAGAELPEDFFEWLETAAVVHLNISNAKIDVPGEEWRWCGPRLEVLDISGLQLKKLRLTRGCNLRKLFAKDNQLESAFLDAPTLEAVDLDHNLFSDWLIIPLGTSLEKLETLSMSGNLLTSLPPGALTHFPLLQHLDLSRNQISNIEHDAFPSLGMQIISIDLSHNQLTSLPHPVLPSLLYLDISSNNLNEMSPLLFAGMPLLQHLKIGNNPEVFSKCGQKCWSDHVDVLTNLVDIDLSNCQISKPIDFSKSYSLKSISLRGNQITTLDGGLLPPTLSILDAGENLVHYTSNFSKRTGTLRDLRLDGNPLICDCSLFEIRDQLLNQSRITDAASYYCFSSAWQHPLHPYLASLRACLPSSSSILPSLVTAFLICVCIVLLIIISLIAAHRLCGSISYTYKRLALDIPVRL
ncbi:unnamed protein product, partial [Mesorhabditis spiculigera]